eukprot:Em0020g402a
MSEFALWLIFYPGRGLLLLLTTAFLLFLLYVAYIHWKYSHIPSPMMSDSSTSSLDGLDHRRCKRSSRRHRKSRSKRHHPHRSSNSSGSSTDSPLICCVSTPARRIVKKIKRGEYTDFDRLLSPTDDAVPEQAVAPEKSCKTKRQVCDLQRWLEAWNIYLAIRIQTAPKTVLQLVKYQSIMCQLFSAYPAASALTYDRLLWEAVARSKPTTFEWDVLKEDILVWCITRNPFRARQQMQTTSSTPRQGPAPTAGNASNQQGNRSVITSTGQEICRCFKLWWGPPRYSLPLYQAGTRVSSTRNLASALKHPNIIDAELSKEIAAGRILGPISECPQTNLRTSGLGAVLKKNGKWRVIMHLSAPEGISINDYIDKEDFSIHYVTVDDAVAMVTNMFASALHWIMATNYAADLIHYFDDFLLAGPPGQPTCSVKVCKKLGIPVGLDKLEGPATTIMFLGITIDTTLQQLRLPPDKLQEMTLLIKSWLGKHKTTKRDLLSLIGKLSFAAKVVSSGCLFLRLADRVVYHSQPTANPSSAGRALSRQMEKLLSRALASSTFNTYQTGIRRHSTNSGTIRDEPEYEPPTRDYPGVHISSVLPTRCEQSQESSEQQPNDQVPCPRRRTFLPAAHLKPKRQPITNEMLGQMLSQLDRDDKPSHDRLMLKAAITLGFFGLLRVSEFTVPNQHGFNPDQHLTTKDITMRKNSMRYLGQVTRSARKPLFLFESGTALRLVLHHLIRRCNIYSLRIGAATAAARSGLPPATIKNLGRWQSEAYKVYTRHPLTQPSDSAVIASA